MALLVAILDQVGRPLPAYWPRRNTDSSWMVGLQLLRDQSLPYGAEHVFTYGPWGFLGSPSGIDLGDLWLAGLFRASAVALLFLTVLSCLPPRRWGVPTAAVLSLLIANCSQSGWIVALALCAFVLSHLMASRTPAAWQLAGAALLSAWLFQIKFSDGLLAIAVVGLLALVTWRPRLWLLTVVAFVVSSLGLWVAAAQSVSDLPAWLRLGWELVGGYGEAMAYTASDWLTWVTGIAALVTALCVLVARRLPAAARVAGLGIVLLATKAAMSRPDPPHLLPGIAAFALVMVAFAPSLPVVVRTLAAPVAGVMAVLMLINLPIMPPRQWSWQAMPVDALPAEHGVRSDQVRADLIDALDIRPDVLTELRGHPVSVDPWEIGAAWAYDLDWAPLPVFQAYAAYTPRLDRANAAGLLADPDHRVLLSSVPPQEGNGLWQSPAYTLARSCSFTVVAGSGEWSVLARAEDRCGEPQVTSTQHVVAGEQVDLPVADGVLVAVRFVPERRSLSDRLLGLTGIQRHLLHATLDGERYRLPETLAGGPLLVSAPAGDLALLGQEPATAISFDRAGQLDIVEIPLIGRESE